MTPDEELRRVIPLVEALAHATAIPNLGREPASGGCQGRDRSGGRDDQRCDHAGGPGLAEVSPRRGPGSC